MVKHFFTGSALFVALLVGTVLFISGCDVNPSKVSASYAKEMAEKVTYTKDKRTGLCFAIIATRKTNSASQSGMGMTEVPCDKVEKYIKK